MTRDIDLVVELAGLDAKSIVALFAADYYVSEHDVRHAIAARTMFNILHLAKVVKLDLVVRKDTPYRCREFEILSKLAWAKESGSKLQLRDAKR